MKKVFSVSQINSYIRRIFESDYLLKKIAIQGEVTNCKYHSSGHIYFSLKDEASTISCVMFAQDQTRGLRFHMENGQQVIVTGRVSVFERDGVYQLYAKDIEMAGVGERYLKLEQLKQELNELGYFDFERKKDLPVFAKKIGIVTSASGAAIEDIKSVARRRNPFVQLYLYPTLVEGAGAARSIAAGIKYFDQFGVDIIIIGRGGGSNESLWAFNERCVADAIFYAETPIISGTGHEIDTTIADYCADIRVETPTAACEAAIFDVYALMQQMDSYTDRLEQLISWKYDRVKSQAAEFHRLFEANNPTQKLKQQKMLCARYEEKLAELIQRKFTNYHHKFETYCSQLDGLSPLRRLRGGYVYAHDADGKPIAHAGEMAKQDTFYLTMSDGEVKAKVIQVNPEVTYDGE